MVEKSLVPRKKYYTLKGKNAEEFLYELAEKTFLTDWCYLNPKLPNGKELCDLLIVFDNIAIIWQVKDVKLKNGKIKESDIEKNLSQIMGAFRQLFELRTDLILSNRRRGEDKFDPEKITQIYLISAFLGDTPFISPMRSIKKEKEIHIFTREFVEIILRELDTISDFINYLDAKEHYHSIIKSTFINGGEEELLGYYLQNNRSFDRLTKESNFMAYIEDGIWDNFTKRPECIAKKDADKVSYLWDSLIDVCHTSRDPQYEEIARVMAKLNRFQRRSVSQALFEFGVQSHNKCYGLSCRRTMLLDGITYCFLFYGDSNDESSRQERKAQLGLLCLIARGKILDNTKVIGIATDQRIKPDNAYDFCYIDKPDWTREDQ